MNQYKYKITKTKILARESLLVQYFIMGFVFSSFLSRFPSLQEHYNLSIAELSFVPFAMSIGALLAMPLCTHLTAKLGCKKLSIAGYFHICFLPLITLMPHLISLYLLCTIWGMLKIGRAHV